MIETHHLQDALCAVCILELPEEQSQRLSHSAIKSSTVLVYCLGALQLKCPYETKQQNCFRETMLLLEVEGKSQ